MLKIAILFALTCAWGVSAGHAKSQGKPAAQKRDKAFPKPPQKCDPPAVKDPFCPENFDPVCGADDRSHQNRCWLEKFSNSTFVKKGRCNNKNCFVKRLDINAPVCSRDGRTFINLFRLECDGSAIWAYDGECKKGVKQTPCPHVIKPVCGSDGLSHLNRCFLDRFSSAKFDHNGRCAKQPCTWLCPLTEDKLCGINGQTFQNSCSIECYSNTFVAYKGACKDGKPKPDIDRPDPIVPDDEEELHPIDPVVDPEIIPEEIPNYPKVCPLVWFPVCGVNNKCYNNACEAAKARVKVAYNKPCVSNPIRMCKLKKPCDAEWNPVCGVDGTTYRNSCWLTCKSDTEFDRQGTCSKAFLCRCANIELPLCGSDAQTWNNPCVAGCAQIKTIYDGPCVDCKKDAPNTNYKPVCSKDGLTYKNAYEASCVNKVYIAHDGACPKKPTCVRDKTLNRVCGVDGKVYHNPMEAVCASMSTQPMHFCRKEKQVGAIARTRKFMLVGTTLDG